MSDVTTSTVSLYVVKNKDDVYFAGFDSNKGQAAYVKNPIDAKKFTNKYDIKLRPDELVVELKVDLSKCPVSISDPFRPARRRVQR